MLPSGQRHFLDGLGPFHRARPRRDDDVWADDRRIVNLLSAARASSRAPSRPSPRSADGITVETSAGAGSSPPAGPSRSGSPAASASRRWWRRRPSAPWPHRSRRCWRSTARASWWWTTATTSAGKDAGVGDAFDRDSCRPMFAPSSAAARDRSAGPPCRATPRTPTIPTGRSRSSFPTTRCCTTGSTWPASASASRACRRASAGSGSASATGWGWPSTDWSPRARSRPPS